MYGMNVVGDLFGSGKMFFAPGGEVKARVMKKICCLSLPYPKKKKKRLGTTARQLQKVLMATVKGDVHDIGKNIVGVVLACNNYDILDLGVMVPLR